MQLITAPDPGYEESRQLFNGMIDRHPAAFAPCRTPDDVVEALALADRDGLSLAVKAGGHSVAGMSLVDQGLVIDVGPMTDIVVDPDARSVRVGAGVRWGAFDAATQAHGLATTGGRVSTTGVAGLTLGGGSGWLERRFGMTCDNLLAVELVTADGRVVTASEDDHPDLFWALHGGGGNFGVATSFTFRLHEVGPMVTGGLLIWPGDAGTDVARIYRDLAHDAPDELGSALVLLTPPPEPFVPEHLLGTTVVGVLVCWTGDPHEGAEVIAPLRALGPEVDVVGPMPYVALQQLIDLPDGLRNYWSGDYHDAFPDDALDVFVKYGFERQSPLAQQILFPFGGAVGRVSADATPLGTRTAAWVSHPFAVWEDPAGDEANIEWARSFRRDIAHYASGGTYLNFVGDEGQDRIRASFGAENHDRLRHIKTEWDPTNRFRSNQNILPALD